ncbi:hypothetical protein QN277_023680 [Acacia crassicarpa]|uniref:Short-chain dehydrogenase/reductase n=1 Tax=Acacia crassicarpa TaxID=499986 RepID=A0AAE1JC05_9FABA|nr:hypothetical protein QN277_023680 [Acacia crassicarpa]
MAEATKRYAVVTGGNKGMGFQICKQLASNGITVVLTARDEKRGLEAVEKLKSESGVSGEVYFHQLDVTNPAASVPSLANFIKTKFGKLDYLVNNAGINGLIVDQDALMAATSQGDFAARIERGEDVDLSKILKENYELAEECFKVNYFGPKTLCEGLIPLLQLSDSPRIVNVSTSMGSLEKFPSGWGKGVLSDAGSLTEEKVEEVLKQFLADYKEGSLETKGWPTVTSAYTVSKALLNAYTRILAKKYPSFCINSVCPGYVKTDMTFNAGIYTVEEGAESIVRAALLPDGNQSGLFFRRSEIIPF